ncbi:protein of unknown function [Candidatus Hydrogenisulfobacillus filiaventi]|uniref:Uncharacterized protein n=1 Tax=Candidatus Hydrogenisulfobacillus filiaventi TaxID=2707344 RepID=A0A6F8ZER7_9FIRM|nr:protein of unknown function [Candidatus Hydrogenisulfobacillus filiaventi]
MISRSSAPETAVVRAGVRCWRIRPARPSCADRGKPGVLPAGVRRVPAGTAPRAVLQDLATSLAALRAVAWRSSTRPAVCLLPPNEPVLERLKQAVRWG